VIASACDPAAQQGAVQYTVMTDHFESGGDRGLRPRLARGGSGALGDGSSGSSTSRATPTSAQRRSRSFFPPSMSPRPGGARPRRHSVEMIETGYAGRGGTTVAIRSASASLRSISRRSVTSRPTVTIAGRPSNSTRRAVSSHLRMPSFDGTCTVAMTGSRPLAAAARPRTVAPRGTARGAGLRRALGPRGSSGERRVNLAVQEPRRGHFTGGLPGTARGGSLMIAQKTPSVRTASVKARKSTGFTT
jgi:hypothetical protein